MGVRRRTRAFGKVSLTRPRSARESANGLVVVNRKDLIELMYGSNETMERILNRGDGIGLQTGGNR